MPSKMWYNFYWTEGQTDEANDWGGTPLYLAAFHDHLDVVKLLLDAGADANKVANDGYTPMYCAVRNSLEMVELLINSGASCTPALIDRARLFAKWDIVTFLNGRGLEDPTNLPSRAKRCTIQ